METYKFTGKCDIELRADSDASGGEISFTIDTPCCLKNDGELNFLLAFLKDKQLDEKCSVINWFASETQIADINRYKPTMKFLLGGILKLTDTQQRSEEEVLRDALEPIVLRLLDKDPDDLCNVCARRQQCEQESNDQGEAWQPKYRTCVDNVVQYFLEQAKK